MRVQKIMCPIDFSDSSTAALDQAASLARQFGAQLLIVHVDEDQPPDAAASSPPSCRPEILQGLLARTAPKTDGVRFKRHLVHGLPGRQIPRFARLYDVDLVVMGRHTSEEHLHRRSRGVCDMVARECQCPVMTVNHAKEHPPWVCVDGDGWSSLNA